MRRFEDLDELVGAVGEELGPGEWFEVTQDRLDLFADAIDDHQWIHVDAERAAAGPYGATIAHGSLTLALIPRLLWSVFDVGGRAQGLNYGLDRVRFPAPVRVGSRIRASAQLVEVTPIEGGVHVVLHATVTCEGLDRPVCVAELVARYLR